MSNAPSELSIDTRTPTRRFGIARMWFPLALAGAGLGVLIEYFSGVPGFPTVPPGPIILGVAALLVVLQRRIWVAVVGVAAAAFVLIGTVLAGVSDRLAAPAEFGPFLGTWLHVIGLLAALVLGGATIANRITRS